MTFHGHCYQKEQEESLKRLISLGKSLGGEYAFEVAMILLQGIDVDENIDEGKEMLRVAESDFKIPSLIERGIYHVKTPSLYYDLLSKELGYFSHEKLYQIYKNPKHLFENGKLAFINNDCQATAFLINNSLTAERCLKFALERDYLEAEFVYSLISSSGSVCDHLLRGAKGGCVESQVFLGLHLIYGDSYEDLRQEGIRWLRTAAAQNKQLTHEMLIEIFTHGFKSYFGDIEKAKEYENHFQSLPRINSQISSEMVENYIQTCVTRLLEI